jgi:flavorubredoxin
MARQLDVTVLVPQHGAPLTGPAIRHFFDWFESLQCGTDLFDQSHYQLPKGRISADATC